MLPPPAPVVSCTPTPACSGAAPGDGGAGGPCGAPPLVEQVAAVETS